GAGSLLDLLTAQAALASARAQAIQARLSWNTALAQLAHDVGLLGLDGSSPLQLQTDTTGTPKEMKLTIAVAALSLCSVLGCSKEAGGGASGVAATVARA